MNVGERDSPLGYSASSSRIGSACQTSNTVISAYARLPPNICVTSDVDIHLKPELLLLNFLLPLFPNNAHAGKFIGDIIMGGVPSVPTDPNRTLQVIGAGFARTGTVSMALALEKLLDGPVCHGGTQLLGREDGEFWPYSYTRSSVNLHRR